MLKSSGKSTKLILSCAKLALALSLVVWMVATGRLDFAELVIYRERPNLLLFSILAWVFGSLFLGAWRWNLLLRGLNISLG